MISPQTSFKRRRITYATLLVLIPLLGIGARANARYLPEFIARYAPDTLWALLVFALVVTLAPRLPTARAAMIALGFSYLIEVSQLYQAPWINTLRATRVGGLLLGFGFLWSDLVCYTVGVGLGVLLDLVLLQQLSRSRVVTDEKVRQ
jgi:hypothetical protein